MSVCLESGTSVIPSQVGKLPEAPVTTSVQSNTSTSLEQDVPKNNVSKLIVANSQENSSSVLQKVNSPVITVVNTPITVVKTIGGGTTSHFTLVNSSVKSPPTITLVAPPITVLKTITDQPKSETVTVNNTNNGGLPVAAVSEKPSSIHNVFVKKSTPAEGGGISIPDMPQSHKLLTANSFPTTNVIPTLNTGPILKTANGQRNLNPTNKLKILSNVVVPGPTTTTNAAPGPSNILLNKNHRFTQKLGNGTTKYLSKTSDKRMFYPIQKNQFKPLYKPPPQTSMKSVSPGAVQRTGAGLRTIPPQRPGPPNKPNYIGKHAVQAQKMKPKVKTKLQSSNNHANRPQHPPEQSAQMIFNQALTAQILETLSDKEPSTTSNKIQPLNSYLNSKYEPKIELPSKPEPREYKPQSRSTLDALSFVCQAVLLDHNYNATLPTEPPPPPVQPSPPLNGAQQFSPVPNYPTGMSTIKRNRSTSQTILQREDDAASDISEERKLDTEGEETDTAPEAEAVANETSDRYGDYVTRCICGFIHDDGYMIECDKCKVWQHVRCVVKTKKVPDDYLCEECDPTKHTDRQKARTLQQQWMREIQERDAKIRKEQMALSDTDSSDGEAPKNRRKEPPRRQRRDSMNSRGARPGKRKERKIPNKRTKGKQSHVKSDDEKIPQIRQWIENYEEAVTNHYSPELRARISSIRLNGAHSELSGHVDPSVCKCKVQSNPGAKCLVATVSLPMSTPVIELRGKYMLSTQHRATTRQQKPGPFLFFHTLIKDTEVCVDTRTYGNFARFVRRSCTPNAELQHVIEKGTLHLYIVTTKSVEKGAELTIRHETHDLAASHSNEIPCACINPEYCALIKGQRRHNGEIPVTEGKKRRGRQSRENIISPPPPVPPESETEEATVKIEHPKEEHVESKEIVKEIKEEPIEEKPKIKEESKEEVEIKQEEDIKEEKVKEEPESMEEELEIKKEPKQEETTEDEETPLLPPPVTTRRGSRHGPDPPPPPPSNDGNNTSSTNEPERNKKLSREERKLQAIMKAIERMEKQEQRKQEHQAKQAHRRESEPSGNNLHKEDCSKMKRRKRKGRARTTSTNSRRNRLDSAESLHSSDETLLSPPSETSSPSKAVGLLLALSNGDQSRKSPERTMDSNSNSTHSSPETPLSSACLLVAAAVEPLEPGFKFPKTKKVLMNEWLNKSDIVQPASAISPSSLTPHVDNNVYSGKTLNALSSTANFCDQTPRTGSAKKRWLRQAISEDQCDSPPQCNSDPVAPPKKRRLPRESLSTEGSPPDTPTSTVPPQVEIVTPQDEDSPTPMESDATLNELATEMRQEYGNCIHLPSQQETPPPPPTPPVQLPEPTRGIMDPRLARFANSEQLVGTVEKSLSFLGFDEAKKPEAITPAKRKLSITEYRQRKKLNNNEKSANDEATIVEESNSSQSPKTIRTRSNSTSSVTSGSTSDDEISPVTTAIPEVKALSAFNSEPTELERQRESVSLRIKKALGLSVDEESNKTRLNVETLLKGGDLAMPVLKPPSTLSLMSPCFSIPGSGDSLQNSSIMQTDASSTEVEVIPYTPEPDVDEKQEIKSPKRKEVVDEEKKSVMYYTPDDEELVESTTSYVPPFNNPLYPNTNYTTYGSVIDDDVPYEGRNPSPPPDLSNEA